MKDRALVLFDVEEDYDLEWDYEEELNEEDWATEADVSDALQCLGYETSLLGLHSNLDLLRLKLDAFKPDIVFNLTEAFDGNTAFDQNIVSFLELKGVAYTGCGPLGLTLCKNKGISKKILGFHKIRVPAFTVLRMKKPIKRPRHIKFPIFVKPLEEEASYGISQASFVENDNQFEDRVRFIHERMQKHAIAEEYIQGREIYASVLGNNRLDVLPLRELKFRDIPRDEPRFASFKAKWDEEYRKKWGISNGFADPLANGVEEKIRRLCKKIYGLLHIKGYARMDLRLTPQNEIVFIEANPNPILVSDEDFAESAKKAGISYDSLIQKIITLGKKQ